MATRLVELGAIVAGTVVERTWNSEDPAIVMYVHDLAAAARETRRLRLQAVVGIGGSGEPQDRGADDVDVWLGTGSPAQVITVVDALWANRLVPFEANLRNGRRAPRRQQAVLVDPDPTWPNQARRLIGRLRDAGGASIIRVDHIGSTSVPGLPAKELIDIQVVVDDLATGVQVAAAARRAGFVHVPGPWFSTDRHGTEHLEEVVVDADPGRPVNVTIQPVSGPIWRDTLLFRDWLRTHIDERDSYASMKGRLAQRPGSDVNAYSEGKLPWIQAALARAERWAVNTGWSPGAP